MRDDSINHKVCACCDKPFYITHGVADYLYKIKTRTTHIYFCKYSCYKVGQEKFDNPQAARKVPMDVPNKRTTQGRKKRSERRKDV